MEDVVVLIEIQYGDGMRSGLEAEVLVDVGADVATELSPVIPHLNLADGNRLAGVCYYVYGSQVEDLIDRRRYDLDSVGLRLHRVGDRRLMDEVVRGIEVAHGGDMGSGREIVDGVDLYAIDA